MVPILFLPLRELRRATHSWKLPAVYRLKFSLLGNFGNTFSSFLFLKFFKSSLLACALSLLSCSWAHCRTWNRLSKLLYKLPSQYAIFSWFPLHLPGFLCFYLAMATLRIWLFFFLSCPLLSSFSELTGQNTYIILFLFCVLSIKKKPFTSEFLGERSSWSSFICL